MNQCLQCQKLTSNQKFCSRSCAATYNGSRRPPRTLESKQKTSNALKGRKPSKNAKRISKTKIEFIQCLACKLHKCVKAGRKTCSIECYNTIRIKNGIRSTSIIYNNVHLDSSWELTVAQKLDELKILWIRPKYIEYIIENKTHKYFPDFYLPKYDLYLDPKNPYRMKIDNDKMKIIDSMVNILYGDLDLILTELQKLK